MNSHKKRNPRLIKFYDLSDGIQTFEFKVADYTARRNQKRRKEIIESLSEIDPFYHLSIRNEKDGQAILYFDIKKDTDELSTTYLNIAIEKKEKLESISIPIDQISL